MIRIDKQLDVLGIIDVQPTFMPGGELPVAHGEAVIPAINALFDKFDHAFATQDWHPKGHVSFASAHGLPPFTEIDLPYGKQMLWPDHALQGTANAALHPDLAEAKIECIIRKGFRKDRDGYSAFLDNDHTSGTGLDGWLKSRGFRRVFFVGLATDYCVAWSADDAADLGFASVVIEDATRGIGTKLDTGGTTMDAARARWAQKGVVVTTSAELA